jgi:hypothetical protein
MSNSESRTRNRSWSFFVIHPRSSIFYFPRLRRWFVLAAVVVLCLAGVLSGAPPAEARRGADPKNAAETAARKKQLEENLQAMEERATGVRIRLAGKTEKSEGRLLAQPLFHYTDEPRRITDATLWGWTSDGRLLAICKIEKYDLEDPAKKWLYCFGSLAPELIEAEWSWGHSWSAKKPGIELALIDSAPAPAEGRPARLRQMKEISNRFAATVTDTTANTRQEMRLLPRPLYRYEKPVGELLDGAVFGLTTNGTNPDAVLVVELLAREGAAAEWKFGVAGMTAGGLWVTFDEKVVWSKPFSGGRAASFDTWAWFWEKTQD